MATAGPSDAAKGVEVADGTAGGPFRGLGWRAPARPAGQLDASGAECRRGPGCAAAIGRAEYNPSRKGVPDLAKPNYAFAKRQRDLAKKQKNEAKRQKKAESAETKPPEGQEPAPSTDTTAK